jgi:hypothetical protein
MPRGRGKIFSVTADRNTWSEHLPGSVTRVVITPDAAAVQDLNPVPIPLRPGPARSLHVQPPRNIDELEYPKICIFDTMQIKALIDFVVVACQTAQVVGTTNCQRHTFS